MNRALALLWLVAAPLAAGAQSFGLASPSIGDALRRMDRLDALRGSRGVAREEPFPQVFVLPERPGQNQVSWYEFDWHHYDVPSPSGGKGGIRLYYYGREREVVELALPVIRNAYLRLVDQFHYTPTQQIPYILYASKREFQTTNVFEVTESVLGVTSPRDLKMSLPYFGDHELFRQVSTHELVHQFTIQKLLDISGGEDTASPIEALPLWFVEGIAEYYAKGGIDAETDMYLRDLVFNPDPEHHYELVAFDDDRHQGYIPTYKLGQARLAFIAEVYGKEKIQGYLENASLLVGNGSDRGFDALTRRVLNERLDQVDARWRAWIKRRYYPQYVAGRQDLSHLAEVRDLPAEPEAFAISPDGRLLFFRGIDRERGRVMLYLADARDPKGAVEIASDNRPGIESLHPIEHSVMAIADGVIVFSAQSGAGDVLYVQEYRHSAGTKGAHPSIELGEQKLLRLKHPAGRRFIEIWDPAFSPDGRQIAFVGISDKGQQDIYVVPREGGTARQLTDDTYSKHDLAWGADGIYYASDATDHGRLNLFRLDDGTGARTRLTTEDADDRHPAPLADGSVLFASDASRKSDLYLLKAGRTRRVTDFTTGLTSPAEAPQARGIWASTFYRGRFRLVEVPRVAFLDEPAIAVRPPSGPALRIPRDAIPEHTPGYRPFALGNWRPEAGAVYGGGAYGGVAGSAAVLFSDVLRDRILLLDLSVYGSFDYTQGIALLEDRSARTTWVVGAYHFVQGQIVLDNPSLGYLQRDFGAVGTLRFPIDRFRRFETELSVGGVQRYCLNGVVATALITCGGGVDPAVAASWEAINGGTTPQLGPTFRYGYDTVRYDMRAGPIAGDALLLEVGSGWLPWKSAVYGFSRIDAVHYFPLFARSKFLLRFAGGTTFAPNDQGRLWSRIWWLTSADNLRGYGPFDLPYLIGRNYYVVNAELQLPLDPLLRFAIFDSIFAVGAFDFGGVFDTWQTDSATGCTTASTDVACIAYLGAWDTRTLTGVLGFNVLFGPLLLRVHFGHPFDIGGIRTPALQNHVPWVTNISLRYFFF